MSESFDLTQPLGTRDLRLIEQAVKGPYEIEERVRVGIIKRLSLDALDPKVPRRAAHRAAAILKGFEYINLAYMAQQSPATQRHEVVNVHVELTAEERIKHRAAVIEMLKTQMNGHANGSSPSP